MEEVGEERQTKAEEQSHACKTRITNEKEKIN